MFVHIQRFLPNNTALNEVKTLDYITCEIHLPNHNVNNYANEIDLNPNFSRVNHGRGYGHGRGCKHGRERSGYDHGDGFGRSSREHPSGASALELRAILRKLFCIFGF
ncbi:hypothetical protein C1645_823767 [Glomus cerebriforme]|uniref:Uncharacterized protein n=1 Tax=Glomus cerebriforme TaxID=658196 RepID=A0A397T513_9GLOM|nr:hypothetical protein C1645_823767 [Glomus cerebriforme]